MKRNTGTIALATLLAGTVAWSLAGAPAAVAAPFYKGKTIKITVRSSPGGGYDFYGRLIARHLARHIPGNPDIIVINLPGAGGIVATNYLMNRAKRNGTELGILNRELAMAQRVKSTGVKYDVRKLIPIGSAASSTQVTVMAGNHPVKTLADLKKYDKPVLMAVTGPGSGSYQGASLLKLDGFPIKVITGYSGGQERFLAIARGEVHGTVNSYESTIAAIREHGFRVIAYYGAKHPTLGPNVPHVREGLSKTGRQLVALMAAPMAAGRPFFTTPGVPADRVKILRAAFKATIEDPQLIKEAKRAKRSVGWTDPKDMRAIYDDTLNAPDEVVNLFLGGAKKPKKDLSKLVKHEGPVTKIKRGGRRVWISYKGKEVVAKISGSRTKVTVAGKKAKRKAITVGMKCRFTYPKPGEEATNVDCK